MRTLAPAARAAAGAASWSSDSSDSLGSGAHGGASGGTATVRSTANPIPRPELAADEIVPLLHRALALNDFPEVDSGLKSMWAFAGDTTRFIYQNNRTEFIEDAHKTAAQFSTSLYGSGMFGTWELETPLTYCGGNCADEAWVATCVVKTVSSDGRMRRWQWELRKHRRPPLLGAWYVESVGSSDRKGEFEID